MNKTKIDWCDMSWNPVTGCLHECKYCYARKIAERFDGHAVGYNPKRAVIDGKTTPFPFGFKPTLYKARLTDPQSSKRPSTIFVCSMADLFGTWVPDAWIREVFEACAAAPQHRYLFLTKNPTRYDALIDAGLLPTGDNMWYGTTCTDLTKPLHWNKQAHTFMSCEPMLGPWPAPNEGSNLTHMLPEWVILGAESGNRKGKVIPERWWVENAVAQCKANHTPVFMKESLRDLMGEDFVQQFPWSTE